MKTELSSTFTNVFKRKYFFFRKMFIVADLVSLTDCDSIPNAALNTNLINMALNTKFGIESQA